MALNAKPSVGLEFDSVDTTWQFWVEYGKKCGFGVRNDYLNKRKVDGLITSGRFVCSKEGSRLKDKRSSFVKKPRADTRSGCPVRISFRLRDGKYVIQEFEETHNHLLQLTETTHMLASHRKISEVQAYEIEMAEDSGLMQKSSFQLMSTQAGGRANLGFTRLDVKNYLKARRQRSMVYGEVGSLMQYFQHQMLDNPSFYHAYQMDCDEQITNIFWADARMILDYGYFGDVVSLDTTYCTNRANRPLALFSGFNHYRGTILFGAALLYDETADSFKWLFETFLEAHGNKKPQTLFTDQAQAMAKALVEVMPKTRHGLCTWHLMQNGIKHLGSLMKGGSDFLTDFKKCMYEYDQEVKFEAAWSKLVAKFDLFDNNWVKSMYGIKQKWASCHMNKAITLGMRSTQLSESLNSSFKACMSPGISVIQFFQHFEKVVEEK